MAFPPAAPAAPALDVPMSSTKANFAAAGGGLAGAVTTLLAPLIWSPPIPEAQQLALSVVLGAAVPWITTYLAPRNQPK